jgi:hypothetical protein
MENKESILLVFLSILLIITYLGSLFTDPSLFLYRGFIVFFFVLETIIVIIICYLLFKTKTQKTGGKK